MEAGADLDHVNRRRWTLPHYLFDPELSQIAVGKLLDICLEYNFDQWDAPDTVGWTILHRAAAFGRAEDVKRLIAIRKPPCLWAEIDVMHWIPIQCAAKYGNWQTFEVLAAYISQKNLITLTDSRGWTVLHLAAENRSIGFLKDLLKRGLDPQLKTSPSSLSVPQSLEDVEVTPREIAKACGNEDVYLQAIAPASAEQP